MDCFLKMFTNTFAMPGITTITTATSNATKITVITTTTTTTTALNLAATETQLGCLFLLVAIDHYLNWL